MDLLWIAMLGGTLALDRAAGWNLLLSQPLVGACLAGALINPGPEWELWVLRVPLGVGILLQFLLTDGALPAAQRSHDTATAGIIGTTVAVHVMVRTHQVLPLAVGGMLWVVLGVAVGLMAAWIGGVFLRIHGALSRADVRHGDRLLATGEDRAFEHLYRGAMLRVFVLGALWCGFATWFGSALLERILPAVASHLTPPRVAIVFATLAGAAVAAAFRVHLLGKRHAVRLAVVGAGIVIVLFGSLSGGGS